MGWPMRNCFVNGKAADAIISALPAPQQRATITGSQTMHSTGGPAPSLSPVSRPPWSFPFYSVPPTLLPLLLHPCSPTSPRLPGALWVTLTSNSDGLESWDPTKPHLGCCPLSPCQVLGLTQWVGGPAGNGSNGVAMVLGLRSPGSGFPSQKVVTAVRE